MVIRRGDVIVMYTDGVTSFDPQGREFGMERLIQVIKPIVADLLDDSRRNLRCGNVVLFMDIF